jgi:hypothetical protein
MVSRNLKSGTTNNEKGPEYFLEEYRSRSSLFYISVLLHLQKKSTECIKTAKKRRRRRDTERGRKGGKVERRNTPLAYFFRHHELLSPLNTP